MKDPSEFSLLNHLVAKVNGQKAQKWTFENDITKVDGPQVWNWMVPIDLMRMVIKVDGPWAFCRKPSTFKNDVHFWDLPFHLENSPLSPRFTTVSVHGPMLALKTYWSSQNVHFEFKGTPFSLEFTRPLEGFRAVVWCLIVTVRFDRGANPGGWLMAFSVLWLVNLCSFSGRVSTVGLGFGRVKKFSLLSVSFRSVLDRKIVIFGLMKAVTLVPLQFQGIKLHWIGGNGK